MSRVSLLALVLAGVALGLVLGRDVVGREPAAVTVVAPAPAALAPTPAPVPAAGSVAPAPPAASSVPPARSTFWTLVGKTRAEAGNDTGRQSELLDERLRRLSPRQIVRFSQTRKELDRRAYTWSMWGAATTIEDGCSDDCFRDFRAYVISLGPAVYERALRDPDSLATVVQDAETGDWENADDVSADAYSSVTGDDFPLDDTDLSGTPSGRPLDLDNAAALARRYPRLAARFR